MAEPIRRSAPPVHRRPQGVRPHPRPRPMRIANLEEARPSPVPPLAAEEPEALPLRAFQRRPDKNLRSLLLTALGIHLAVLLLAMLFSATPAPGLSDTLLASAVLVAGAMVLVLSGSGRRAG